ncbi:hypothetical protein AXF42_Ash015212 [Apostasia shenzhenica]|uniref:DUF1664 domain-containing protein n=1 Tax=Apostasia shenzhenica TaxID=1088818 RepID=A0A2I0AQL4_9ASPA|nr:hypothetical protein AXF42_Ash015212 [Apostasia shenzhenica]
MKLLSWMQRKFWQNSGDPTNNFGKEPTCNCLSVGPPPGDRRHHLTPAVPAPEKGLPRMSGTMDHQPSVLFDGLLSIGTFGSPIFEVMIEEAKSAAAEKAAEKKVEEATGRDLLVMTAELQKVVAAEAEKGTEESRLQGFLFGSPVSTGETAPAVDLRSEHRASLGELFMRSRAAEEVNGGVKGQDSVREDGGGGRAAAGAKVMGAKRVLKSRRLASAGAGGKCSASETNLQKILRLFHRKIHPEQNNISSKKQYKKPIKIVTSGKFYTSGSSSNRSNSKRAAATTNRKDLGETREGVSALSRHSTALGRSSSDGKQEQWIKSDEDYRVTCARKGPRAHRASWGGTRRGSTKTDRAFSSSVQSGTRKNPRIFASRATFRESPRMLLGSCQANLNIEMIIGVLGSILSKEGGLSDITDFFTSAFKHGDPSILQIATKHLQQDKSGPRSTAKPGNDTLLAQSAKRHLSSKIDVLDNSLDEMKDLNAATKGEVLQLHGDIDVVHVDVQSVSLAVKNLESKMDQLDYGQDSASSSQRSIEPAQVPAVSRTGSLPPLTLEPPSPSYPVESPKVLRSATTVSAAGLKELQDVSNSIRPSTLKTSPRNTPDRSNQSCDEPSSSSSGRFSWRIPVMSVLTRTKSTAS